MLTVVADGVALSAPVALVDDVLTVCVLDDVVATDVVDEEFVAVNTGIENTLALVALDEAAETAVCAAAVICDGVIEAVVLALVLASV